MSEQLDQGTAQTTEPVGGAPAPEAQPATPELTIQDLGNLRAIIDVASQRGACGRWRIELLCIATRVD